MKFVFELMENMLTTKISTPSSRRLVVEKDSLATMPTNQKELLPVLNSTPTKVANENTPRAKQTSDNGINSSQQNAIYCMISKFFGLSVSNHGGGKFQSNLNGNSSHSGKSNQSAVHNQSRSSDAFDSVAADIGETLQLILDRLLQLVEVAFLENVLEYLNAPEDKMDSYKHLFTCSGFVSLI